MKYIYNTEFHPSSPREDTKISTTKIAPNTLKIHQQFCNNFFGLEVTSPPFTTFLKIRHNFYEQSSLQTYPTCVLIIE